MTVETASKFLFISDLCESRSFTTRDSINSYNYKKLSEYAYLMMVGLLLLSKINKKEAAKYSRKTVVFNNFDKLRLTVNDLYVLVYNLLGNNENYKYNDDVKEKCFISELDVKRFLAVIASDVTGDTFMPSFFYGLERQLRMSNGLYRNLRRGVIYWDYKTEEEKQNIFKNIVFNLQKFSYNSDIKHLLEKVYNELI